MTARERFLEMIDNHKNKLINPVEMLDWVWLRVFILNLPEEIFKQTLEKTCEDLSK